VPEDGGDAAVLFVFAVARTQDQYGGQSGETTEGVDDGGAGEIVETQLVEPAAAPFPGTGDRVQKGDQYGGIEHEVVEFDALGYGSRDDSGGGGGEHRLEDEIRPIGITWIIDRGQFSYTFRCVKAERAIDGQKTVEIARIHGIKTSEGVSDEAYRYNEKVFEENVDCILLSRQAGFQGSKAQVHDEDQDGGDQNP
jgi:hypothetical protein